MRKLVPDFMVEPRIHHADICGESVEFPQTAHTAAFLHFVISFGRKLIFQYEPKI